MADIEMSREEFSEYILSWRGITVGHDRVCDRCGGSGGRVYASTATWRGGIGGQALTYGVCDKCWGSGQEDRPWPSHREFYALKKSAEQESR